MNQDRPHYRHKGTTNDQLETRLERWAECAADGVVIGEHVIKSAKERLHRCPAFGEIHKQVIRFRQEHVIDIGHDEHSTIW